MNTTQWLLLVIISLPVIEIYLLIKMISSLGLVMTLILLIGAALMGSYLLRNQGWQTWIKVNEALQRGELPTEELLNGSLIALGAGLLLFPGFMSDIIAMICLIPFTRTLLIKNVVKNFRFQTFSQNENQTSNHPSIIDGEYKRNDE